VEANPRYDAFVTDVFHRISRGAISGVTAAGARLHPAAPDSHLGKQKEGRA
jgi:hypothetical protein